MDSREYLKSLGMDLSDFTEVSGGKVDELAKPGGEGWSLIAGQKYKWVLKARDWNGHCRVDYSAYVPDGANLDGRVYLGMYCQT
ncbi:hypothetical protein ACWGDE_04215 [Streptomyces sp. NPDC054956]